RLRLVPGALRVAALELTLEAGRRRLGQPARQEEVAGVPARNVDHVASEAERVDVLRQHDLHGDYLSPTYGRRASSRARLTALALVPPAGAGDPPVPDLALLGHVSPELVDVLVVDLVDLRLAEEAALPPAGAGRGAALAAAGAAFGPGCCQSFLLRTGCRRLR